jgi:predicted nucleic-acid-binding protein
MIGLDTNILVRYLAQDDPVQSAKATRIMEYRLTEDPSGFHQCGHDSRDRLGSRAGL